MGLKWVPLIFAAFKVGLPLGALWLTVREFLVGPLVFAAFRVGPWFLQHSKRVPSGFEMGSLGFCSI